jgi:hypothetical protein
MATSGTEVEWNSHTFAVEFPGGAEAPEQFY